MFIDLVSPRSSVASSPRPVTVPVQKLMDAGFQKSMLWDLVGNRVNFGRLRIEQSGLSQSCLLSKVDIIGRKSHRDDIIIEQLTHEIALLKRHRFAKRSEQISPEQGSLLDDLLNTHLRLLMPS